MVQFMSISFSKWFNSCLSHFLNGSIHVYLILWMVQFMSISFSEWFNSCLSHSLNGSIHVYLTLWMVQFMSISFSEWFNSCLSHFLNGSIHVYLILWCWWQFVKKMEKIELFPFILQVRYIICQITIVFWFCIKATLLFKVT